MADEDGFFRAEVLDLLFEEENDEVLDKIFDPLFMEATIKSFTFLHKIYEI